MLSMAVLAASSFSRLRFGGGALSSSSPPGPCAASPCAMATTSLSSLSRGRFARGASGPLTAVAEHASAAHAACCLAAVGVVLVTFKLPLESSRCCPSETARSITLQLRSSWAPSWLVDATRHRLRRLVIRVPPRSSGLAARRCGPYFGQAPEQAVARAASICIAQDNDMLSLWPPALQKEVTACHAWPCTECSAHPATLPQRPTRHNSRSALPSNFV
mmetsp:Transcript_41111/g.92303  ORF Transcript_41111/g.92303 Transcript_41111/m.92303 type:complete len:218 (-) Transcript_41111:575-1228(-)